MIFNPKKILFLFSLLPFFVFAQFSKDDSALVRTTFKREFNREIIYQYFQSSDPAKVKAALLSISHSNDTSFINEITRLDYSKYGNEICFALGQLGPNSLSESFLLDKLNNNLISSPLLQALAKCGNKNSFDALIAKYNKAPKDFNGISLALFNFSSRGIFDKAGGLPVILNELNEKSFTKERQADAAFTIYRANLAGDLKEGLVKEIKAELKIADSSDAGINKLYYLTGSIRSVKYFPDDKELFNSLLKNSNEIIRIETAKSLAYYNFRNEDELNSYLSLFDDENPNVTRTAAAALKDINIGEDLWAFLQKWSEHKIKNSTYSVYTKGELLKSYISLFTPDFNYVVKEFSSYVQPIFMYQAAASFAKSDASLNYLLENFDNESNKNKLAILQSLIDFQSNFKSYRSLRNCLINALNSDFAPLVSIAGDGIDSLFISLNWDTLSLIVQKQAKKYLNDPDFIEAIFSLVNLAEKIDTAFSTSVLHNLAGSELFSVQKFVANKSGNETGSLKDESIFPLIWENAFKYTFAEVETSKGKFKIKFLPSYAPVSVGNFVYSASKGFFNNIFFHRVVPAFVIQGGDPTGTGWGGPGYDIISEASWLSYVKGMVGMASAGKDTEGSQWFVTTGYYPHLNGRYTIFAEAVEGMEIIYKVDQDDKILSVELF